LGGSPDEEEHFSVRGDGRTTISLNAATGEALVARSTIDSSGFLGTVFLATVTSVSSSAFHIIKVLLFFFSIRSHCDVLGH
jgi:hypothetical protein